MMSQQNPVNELRSKVPKPEKQPNGKFILHKGMIVDGGVAHQDFSQVQAVVQKPIKYVENIWGQDIRSDKRERDYDISVSLKPKTHVMNRMNTGSLPYATSPRLRRNMSDRMIPLPTTLSSSRVCWNECVNTAGPHYLRYWPIWDNLPILPSVGNIALDPRYGENTREFTKSYTLKR